MKPIRLLIAAVVLAGLGGAVWWSNKDEAAKEAKPPADTSPKILSLNAPDIQQIEIHQREGDVTTVLKRQGTGKWSITAPKPLAADQSAVESLTSASNLHAERVLEDAGSDLASFGLAPPVLSIAFTDKTGKATKLLVGEATPTNTGVYAKLEGDPRVFTMLSSHKVELDRSSKDLREKHLLMWDSDKISSVEVTARGETIVFGHTGDNNWQILKPKVLRADGAAVEELMRKVRDATMDASASEKDAAKVAAGFAGAQPVATVRITDPAGQKTLEIRKNKDDCYAKSSTLEGVYKANKDLCDGMDKALEAYRNKKLFDFSFSDPSKIEFKDGDKTATYEKSGNDWKSGGKTMDSVAIQNLIDKLRDVSASKLVDTGFTTPLVEIGIVAGKFNEKVQISTNNGMFFAHRDGDTTTYQMEPATVADLRTAASGIQPAPDKKQDKK
jgi:hypothetical protein